MLREVTTKYGKVKGIEAADPRITAFKGIPFAAPPVGINRWRAPQPCESWDGVKECYRFKAISVQDTPGIGDIIYNREWHVDPEIEISEDNLYLNIWTPAKTGEEKMPVLVWFFGGGLQWGYTSEMEMDGERIARRGIVVVSVNYRLNVFGFLAHPELTKEAPEAPSNFGSLDQQAGLNWVIENIKAFGGDPENITICGQSAGGGSVMSQLSCPSNSGKIRHAIVESAIFGNPYAKSTESIFNPITLEEGEKLGERFFEFMGVKTLEEARALDAFYIREKYAEFAESNPRMFNVRDGKFCVGYPQDRFKNGEFDDIPIMAGNTKDEFHVPADSDAFGPAPAPAISGLEYQIKALFERNGENGKKSGCYYYEFDVDIPGEDNPGTFHSVDLWFFFETLAKCTRPFTGRHYDIARQMCDYWCNFIKTGNPNGKDINGAELPEWRPYSKSDNCQMVFGKDGCITNNNETEYGRRVIDFLKK